MFMSSGPPCFSNLKMLISTFKVSLKVQSIYVLRQISKQLRITEQLNCALIGLCKATVNLAICRCFLQLRLDNTLFLILLLKTKGDCEQNILIRAIANEINSLCLLQLCAHTKNVDRVWRSIGES